MRKFLIDWTNCHVGATLVEAETFEEAKALFWSMTSAELDLDIVGEDLQVDDVWEVKE